MRALVTGSTGFIGSHLVRELRDRGWELVCASRRPVKCNDPGIVCLLIDLLNPSALTLDPAQVGPIDTVFHLAAILPQVGPVPDASFLDANGIATLRLLDLAARLGANAFVYMSSMSVIDRPQELPVTEQHSISPMHPYALGKLCGELACEMVRQRQDRRITSLRITSPYGIGMSNGSVLPKFVQQAFNSENITWYGSGQRTQDFVHVKDVISACLLAAETLSPGVYNVGRGNPISMKDLAELVLNLIPQSRSQARSGGIPDPQESFRWEVDITKAFDKLGYSPKVRLEAGLREYIDFIRSGERLRLWWN